MSKRRLFVTILVFILVIALIIGLSYVVSLFLKNTGKKPVLGDPDVPDSPVIQVNSINTACGG